MTMVDTHTLTAGQIHRLLEDIADYQLARFGGFTYRIQPDTGELDYDGDRTVTERVDQLGHQLPGLITVVYPLEGQYEALWSLTDAGRQHLAQLRAPVHAVGPAEDPYALCGHDTRSERELRSAAAVPLVDEPGRSPARGDAALDALHQALGQVWDRLAETTDPHQRATLFIDAADLQHDLAYLYNRYATEATPYQDGHTIAGAHISTGQLFDALADVEFIVAGSLARRHATATPFEAAAGAILNRMAATPNVTARALMLAELHAAVEPVIGEWAAEDLTGLPYAPGMTGWVPDEPRPRTVSLRAIVRAGWRRFRGAR